MCVYRRRGERLNDDCVFQKDQFGGGLVMVWGRVSLKIVSEYNQQIPQPQTADNLMAPQGGAT